MELTLAACLVEGVVGIHEKERFRVFFLVARSLLAPDGGFSRRSVRETVT
jgi:hypothetical protein